MASFLTRTARAAALAAAVSMAATPAVAAPLGHAPRAAAANPLLSGWSVEQETVHRHRWGGWGGGYGGWGRGYGGWGHRHHHDGVDAGDVLAGVLIIGGIAAIASAASRDRDRDRRVETDPNGYPYRNDRNREWDYRYRENAGRDYRSGGRDRGLDNAADICAREVERTERVDEVGSVDRTASGWHVEGRLANGRNFSCEIDNDGRLGPVDLGGNRVGAADGQWNDDAYARARQERDDKPEA
jgi:hypothetical protein